MSRLPLTEVQVFATNKDDRKKYKEAKRKIIILEEKLKKSQQEKELLEKKIKCWQHSHIEGSKYREAMDKIGYLEKANTDLFNKNKNLRVLMRKEILERKQFRVAQALTHGISPMEVSSEPVAPDQNGTGTEAKKIKPTQSKRRAMRRKFLMQRKKMEAVAKPSPAHIAVDLDFEELSD